MKNKQLFILIAAAIVLGAIAYFSGSMREKQAAPKEIGGLLLPDLPVNDVEKILFVSPLSTVSVVKSGGRWVVPERDNYPADFTKVVETLREFSELKIGQTLTLSDAQLPGLKLLDPDKTGEDQRESAAARIELRGAGDKLLASFLAGAEFMRKRSGPPSPYMDADGYPDGRYIRMPDGRVLTISSTLTRFMRDTKEWLKEDSLNVAASNAAWFCMSGGKNTEKLEFTRPEQNKPFETSGITPAEDEDFDKNKINRAAGALRYLGFDDVADSSLGDEETGLNEPAAYSLHAEDGKFYTVSIGAKVPGDKDDRYARIGVEWKEPGWAWAFSDTGKDEAAADSVNNGDDAGIEDESGDSDKSKTEKTQAAKQKSASEAADLNKIFAGWTYILRSHRVEPMLFGRDDLIKKKEKPKEEKKESETTEKSESDAKPDAAAQPEAQAEPGAPEKKNEPGDAGDKPVPAAAVEIIDESAAPQ